jgi:hypothetical protein
MCLCATLDGAQFEDPQGQDFEEFPEQQQFANEGKWSLIMFSVLLISQSHLYFICMHVSRICRNPKLRICLVSFKLPCLNLGCFTYVIATLVAY